ncbi:MAG: hypothetical protein ABEK50_12380 [bacterium]
MSFSIRGTGQGFFINSPGDKPDILRQNTVFKPPSDNINQSNLVNNNRVFSDPDSDTSNQQQRNDQSTNRQRSGSRNQSRNASQNSLFSSIPTQVRLGSSLKQFEAFENAPPQGGNALEVSGQNITVKNQDGESVSFEASDEGRLIQTEDNTFLLRNDTTETSIEIDPGQEVSTEGSGQLTVFGEDNPVTVDAGSSFDTTESPSGLGIRNPNTASTLGLSESNNSLTVQSQRSNETDTLTVQGEGGAFLEFSQGQTGNLTRNDDGTITITNEATDESITVSSESELDIGGQAKGILENNRSAGTLTLTGEDTLTLNTGDDGALTVRDETSAQSTSIAQEQQPPQPSRPVRLQFFENLENRRLRAQTEQLITRPQQERSEQAQEDENKRQEDLLEQLRKENEDRNRQTEEDNRERLASNSSNSPFERSNPSKFSRLGNNNRNQPGNTNRNQGFRQNPRQNSRQFGRPDPGNLQSLFGASNNSNRSSFTFQA